MKNTTSAVICSMLIAVCISWQSTNAAEKATTSKAPPKPDEASEPADKKPKNSVNQVGSPITKSTVHTVSPITKAAVNAGALSCASRIEQVVSFLGTGSTGTGAHLYVSPEAPDHGLMSISLEIETGNTSSVYAGTIFAPNQANGCGAMYEAVAYWNMQCGEVAEKQFSGLKNMGVLRKEITVLDGGVELKIFLMPAEPGGCVSIKKEVVR